MRRKILLAVALAALPLVAHAEDMSWPISMYPSKKSCPAEKTKDVKLEDVMKSPRAYDGQCVRLKGYYRGRALFIDPDDILVKYPSSNKEVKDGRIGVSGSNETMARLYRRYDLEYVELTGKIWQCEDKGPWMGGYCHYIESGPFIGVISIKSAREPLRYRDDNP